MKRRSEKEEELSSAMIDDEDDISEHAEDGVDAASDDQGEQIDFTDEDEEEEEEEEEYEAKPKKKKAKRNRFVDMEAEVGDESEEEEDEGGLGGEDELEEDELPTAEEYLRRAPLMPRVRPEEVEVDAEAEEARLRRLYGQSSRALDESGSSSGIPKGAMLLPRATDPKLWLVKCKIGRERDAVAGLLRGLLGVRVREEAAGLDAGVTGSSPQVFSAVCRDTLKGYIYVEAYRPADIIQAVQTLHLNHMLYASHLSKPALVPMGEMADVLSVAAKAGPASSSAQPDAVLPGDWVRVKRGKYSGDLAQILEAPETTDSRSLVKVRLLPRLSYRSGSNAGSKDRVPARPFDPQEASQYGPVTKSRGLWLYGGESYRDGFLVKEVRLASLSAGAAPRPDELERFGVTGGDDDAGASPRRLRQAKTAPVFAKDEQVVVVEGDMKGLVGRVLDVSTAGRTGPAWTSLLVDHADIKGPVSVRADQLRRHFGVGDKVRHVQSGETGMVVAVEADGAAVLFFSYLRQSQAWVSPDALQDASAAATDPGLPPTSAAAAASFSVDFDLDDLVQTVDAEGVFGVVTRVLPEEAAVSVIDQAGSTRSLPVASLKKIVTPPAAKATEQFKAGDRVQVDSAEGGPASRAATVLQVHRNVAFCRALDTREVVVRRLGAVHAMAAYMAHGTHQSGDSPRKGLGGGPMRHLLGKSVAIIGGPHKGYIGIVKSVADETVRVELHTNSRMVSVHRDRVVPAGPDAGGRDGPRGFEERGKTPAWSAAKTPGWSAAKTPAWSSAKTPAWGAARTPAHGDISGGGGGGGGKTPAWNASAAKTPAWNASAAKTPAWNASAAKTPLWSSASARTPAHGSAAAAAAGWSAPTPAWNSAAAPPSSAPTPSSAVWAVPGAMVKVRGSASEMPIASASGGQAALPTGTFSLGDLEPVLPAKRDRVRLVGPEEASSAPATTGTVIGLDGGDAVVRLDGSSSFRIVKLANLVKLQAQQQ